jgi:hypothetical protein
MPNNLYIHPAYGKAITLDDQGMYCVLNQKTGTVQNVIHLVYEQDDWYMYQLQNTHDKDSFYWAVMADTIQPQLMSMSSEQICHYLAKPEYAEPKGAWQVMRNGQYGFGKFTHFTSADIAYAILVFADNALRGVIRLHKLEDEAFTFNRQSADSKAPALV